MESPSRTMTVESRYLMDFQRHKPLTLNTYADVSSPLWDIHVEKRGAFPYQVHCGTYMLKGEAHFRWEGDQKIIAPHGESITWCQLHVERRGALLVGRRSKDYCTTWKVHHLVPVQRNIPPQILSCHCQNEITG